MSTAAISGTSTIQPRTLLLSDVKLQAHPACRGVLAKGGEAAAVYLNAKLKGDDRETYAQMTGLDYTAKKANHNCIRFSQFVSDGRAGMVLTAAEAAKALSEGKKVYAEVGFCNAQRCFEPKGDRNTKSDTCALLSNLAEFYPFARNHDMVDGR